MTKKKSYDETSVLRSLARRKGLNINYSSKVINVSKDAIDVGNSTWGKIDYLTNYCGWFVSMVNKISKNINIFKNDDNDNKRISKLDKKQNKINLVKQVKNSMKKLNKK